MDEQTHKIVALSLASCVELGNAVLYELSIVFAVWLTIRLINPCSHNLQACQRIYSTHQLIVTVAGDSN